ncbi:MAG TPA: histidinol dehydrogenase, partial [Planctomycetota bacterium]|nr:histidinol dehydrogenase [Planctomycetota bacterium]
MRIIELKDDASRELLREMQAKLAVGAGATTPDAGGKTVEIFGEALSPQAVTARIIEDVRREGDAAVFRYTRAFDGFALSATNLRVSAEEVAEARQSVSAAFVRAAEAAIANVRRFQESILVKTPAELTAGGRRLGVRYVPVRRVGVHVPGFSAPLPSSVIMNCVPAQVAGVEEIAVATPPQTSGKVAPETLACCHLLGITEIYRAAGVQAIAALVIGTRLMPKVDMIVGPGRMETQLAKKLLVGEAAIDLLAGPSEVLVLADDTARAE